MGLGFKDHFSGHAAQYNRYRPDYPTELFRFLASQCASHDLAWDCATGSGQAALALTRHVQKVIATDASAEQLSQATAHERVTYLTAPAEHVPLKDNSVDLITVAQALHWFELEEFYSEVHRVLKPGGILAVWNYKLASCTPAIDDIVYHLYNDIVGPYWPPERTHIENDLRDLDFPYTEAPSPGIKMTSEWALAQLLGYLRTWSAVQRYMKKHGEDPVTLIEKRLNQLWKRKEQTRRIQWPLSLRWGYKS